MEVLKASSQSGYRQGPFYTNFNPFIVINFFKQPRIGFGFEADTLSRAGRTTNLTIAGLFGNQNWIDLEAFGCRVMRERREVAVDTPGLGTFGLAVR